MAILGIGRFDVAAGDDSTESDTVSGVIDTGASLPDDFPACDDVIDGAAALALLMVVLLMVN